MINAVVVALNLVSGVMPVKTGVIRKRYDVPAVSPVTVALVVVLLARTNSLHVVPSVEISIL